MKNLISPLRTLAASPVAWIVACLALAVFGISPAVALVGGVALGLTWGAPAAVDAANRSKTLLQTSIVLLGFGTQLDVIARVGASSLGITLLSIGGTIALAFVLGKAFRVDRELTTLVGSGTAICGGSAIGAMAPSIGASPGSTGIAMAVIFLLNGVALVVFPALGHALGMSQDQFGLWSALAIHDTSSVAGAASAYGREALELATTIKLTRALWIIPVAFVASQLTRTGKSGAKFPWFLLGFAGAALVAWLLPAGAPVYEALSSAGHALMAPTLFLLGASITRESLKRAGARPLILGIVLWVIVSAVTAWLVLTGTWSVTL